MADGIKRAPIGIADRFVFCLKSVHFAVRCYVVEYANYQLLLGTEFLVATGAGLFPRWNMIIVTLLSEIEIEANCKRIIVAVVATPLSEEDPDEYGEEEFNLLPRNVPTNFMTVSTGEQSVYYAFPD